jgi:hypothetical protein
VGCSGATIYLYLDVPNWHALIVGFRDVAAVQVFDRLPISSAIPSPTPVVVLRRQHRDPTPSASDCSAAAVTR